MFTLHFLFNFDTYKERKKERKKKENVYIYRYIDIDIHNYNYRYRYNRYIDIKHTHRRCTDDSCALMVIMVIN